MPVAHVDDAIAITGGFRIVRDHQHGLSAIPDSIDATSSTRYSEFSVSRFPVGSSASTTAGLLIKARARATRCCSPPESSDGRWSKRSAQSQQIRNPLKESRIVVPLPEISCAIGDIRTRTERRQQVEFLKYESDFALAHARALRVGERCNVIAIENHFAGIGLRQSSEQIKQSRLAAARRPDHADELSSVAR